MTEPIDRFHLCALAVGFQAALEGWLGDSQRVKYEVYQLYENGGFQTSIQIQPQQQKE